MDVSGNECSHSIIEDYIDIDSDKSQQIFYCEKCMQTFCSITPVAIKQPNRQSGSEHQTHSSLE